MPFARIFWLKEIQQLHLWYVDDIVHCEIDLLEQQMLRYDFHEYYETIRKQVQSELIELVGQLKKSG